MGLNESDSKLLVLANTCIAVIDLDQVTTNDSKSPRGIRGFSLDTGNFSNWKVQGKVGGYTK